MKKVGVGVLSPEFVNAVRTNRSKGGGMSQAKIAKEVGMPAPSLYSYLGGRPVSIYDERLKKIAELIKFDGKLFREDIDRDDQKGMSLEEKDELLNKMVPGYEELCSENSESMPDYEEWLKSRNKERT